MHLPSLEDVFAQLAVSKLLALSAEPTSDAIDHPFG